MDSPRGVTPVGAGVPLRMPAVDVDPPVTPASGRHQFRPSVSRAHVNIAGHLASREAVRDGRDAAHTGPPTQFHTQGTYRVGVKLRGTPADGVADVLFAAGRVVRELCTLQQRAPRLRHQGSRSKASHATMQGVRWLPHMRDPYCRCALAGSCAGRNRQGEGKGDPRCFQPAEVRNTTVAGAEQRIKNALKIWSPHSGGSPEKNLGRLNARAYPVPPTASRAPHGSSLCEVPQRTRGR